MQNAKEVIRALCKRVVAKKETLTTLGQTVGDGDFGVNLERGAVAVLAARKHFSTHPQGPWPISFS